MSEAKIPARLKVIMARSAPYAVIFRRGPSNCVCTIGWDLSSDTFTLGQWLRGHIYPYRADLSPDGKHMIYFATDFRRSDKLYEFREQLRLKEFGADPEPDYAAIMKSITSATSVSSFIETLMADGAYDFERKMEQRTLVKEKYAEEIAAFSGSPDDGSCSWTAISRAPYLKALDLWFNGSAWNGGGLFMDQNSVWLNSSYVHRHRLAKRGSEFNVSEDFPFEEHHGGEDAGVYFPRLQRDGWVLTDDGAYTATFVKELDNGWTLRKYFSFGLRSGYYETHALSHADGDSVPGAEWCWADYDRPRKRVLFAQAGKIFALKLGNDSPKLLYDATPLEFTPLPAPY